MAKTSGLDAAITKINGEIAELQRMRDYLLGIAPQAEASAPPKRGRPRKKRGLPAESQPEA